MKSIASTALVATFLVTFLAAAASVQAAEFITDPLVQDLAANGQIFSPHGIWTGR